MTETSGLHAMTPTDPAPAAARGSAREDPPQRRRREPRVPRRELRIVGHTVATYDVAGDDKRTAGYVRRLFAQRRIPDDATIQLAPETITVEWTS